MGTPYFTRERTERPWIVVDVEDQVLGRAATAIAKVLVGKHRPEYTPGQDCGGFVVVVNAAKIRVSGNKMRQKVYYRHSGYPGGITKRTLEQRMQLNPAEVVRDAVKGMLPRNKLGKRLITKLKVYAGPEHPHQAQQPVQMSVEQLAAR